MSSLELLKDAIKGIYDREGIPYTQSSDSMCEDMLNSDRPVKREYALELIEEQELIYILGGF